MTEKVRVQDDLYSYVNQEWIDQAVIPDDKPSVGGFRDLDEGVEKLMISDFNKMASGELAIDDPNVRKAVDLFVLAKNVEKRNAEGIAPILDTLHKIDAIADLEQFNAQLKDLILQDLPLPFDIGIASDMKDTRHHSLFVSGPRVILPDVTYYKPEREQQKQQILGLWTAMVKQLLAFTDLTSEAQEQYINDALAFDAIIATLVKSSEEWAEYTKVYNPMKVAEVSSLMEPVAFVDALKGIFNKLPENIIIAEPRFLQGFKTLFNQETFQLYKHWAYITYYSSKTSFLSEQIREIGAMYRNALSGIAKVSTIEKQAYNIASSIFSEPVGLYYGKKYFGDEAKKDVVEMVKEIIETYKKRMRKNDFLSEKTKEKAILKLSTMVIKMGYPDKCDELYDSLTFDKNSSLCKAVTDLRLQMFAHNLAKLHKPVNRGEWAMPGHMVNACYSPMTNDITFPAAILQAPFYSLKQSRSENLGGIGAVIAHEISHAFDNNGANCDENGNLNNWWTDEDSAKFKAKTQAMAEEFDGIELPWGKVNGAFIVSENIADNGGMAATLEIMRGMPNADYAAYFYNFARVWCMKARPEYQQLLLSVDVHAPSMLRANMQPRNFEEWYTTFDVKSTDKMYLAPEKRVVIW